MDKYKKVFATILVIIIFLIPTIIRMKYASIYARSWDEVDFALGVNNFDLFFMQPHFPGYPFFILGGKLVHTIINNPALSLSVFNCLISFSACIPIYWVAKRYLSHFLALLVTFFIYTLPYSWILSTDPMSEAAAISILWWYVWSLFKAKESKAIMFVIIPLTFFSLLLGIRLSYLPFGIGILFLWFEERKWFVKKRSYLVFIILQAILAILLQLVWIVALIVSEGGLRNFIELALGFTSGHFNDWGGTATSEHDSIWGRAIILLFDKLFWSSFFVHSWLLGVFYLILFSIMIYFVVRRRGKTPNRGFLLWLFGMMSAYFLWVLLAQNIEKPRHIYPIVGIVVFIIFILSPQIKQKLVIPIILLIFLAQSIFGVNLVVEKRTSKPTTYQLFHYLNQYDKPFVVYTWEEMRVMDYLNAPFIYKQIFTYDYFLEDITHYQGKRVFLTDHVLKGFEQQGNLVTGKVKKVAEFHSNPLFDPIYHHIILYEWINP